MTGCNKRKNRLLYHNKSRFGIKDEIMLLFFSTTLVLRILKNEVTPVAFDKKDLQA